MAQFAKCELRPVGLLYGMLFRSGYRLVVLLAASACLLGGCRSYSVSTYPPAADPGSAAYDPDRDLDAEEDRIEAHAHYATAVAHEMNGDAAGALSEFYEAAVLDLQNEPLILEVSRKLLQAKQFEKARDLLVRATSRPKASGNLFARLGFTYFQLGKPDQAVLANRTAIRREPRSLVGYQNLFLIFLQQKKLEPALRVLDDAAKVSGTDSEFLIGLGELYANYGSQNPSERKLAHARGLAVLQRAIKEKPSDPQLGLRLADGLNMLGQPAEAAKIYQNVLEDLPDVAFLKDGVRTKLADIYLREKDHARATQQLEAIVRDNPTDAQAYYFLGSIAYSDTNFTQAAEYFSKVILLNPEFEQAYFDLAASRLNHEKPAQALETLAVAREKFPQRFMTEYLTGMAYSQQHDFTNALAHFTAAEIIAQATDPKQLKDSFYFQLGATSERAGDIERAKSYLEKCLELSPNDDEAQNYLGFLLADRGEELDRARELIERALKARPDNAAYLDSMGWVMFRLNKNQEALDYLQRAIKNSEEEDPTLYDHLGDVYAALQQVEKAREAWKKSLAVEDNETVRNKLKSAGAQ